jgi:TolA-binding protein
MKHLVLVFLFLLSWNVFAHNHQVQYDSLVDVYFSAAKKYMQEKQYDSAHTQFKELFKLKSTIPDDAAYYYGLNQLGRGNYKQAQVGFEKYIRLRGDQGMYFDSSLYYIAQSQCFEKGYVEVKEECTVCHGTSESKVKCTKCKGVGKEYCSMCSGSGVVISKTNMGDSYQKCTKCQGTGITLCSTCNGTLLQNGNCPQCSGHGFITTRKACK